MNDLKWTRDIPAGPGYYWFKPEYGIPGVMYVYSQKSDNEKKYGRWFGWWAGPLTAPELPSENAEAAS